MTASPRRSRKATRSAHRREHVCLTACFYCRQPFGTEPHEDDHFPVPLRNGGSALVCACVECHRAKGGNGFWGTPLAEALMSEFLAASTMAQRILLARFIESFSDVRGLMDKNGRLAEQVRALGGTVEWENQP